MPHIGGKEKRRAGPGAGGAKVPGGAAQVLYPPH
jgi:hypothetical protein